MCDPPHVSWRYVLLATSGFSSGRFSLVSLWIGDLFLSSAVPVPFQCRSGLPAPSNDAFRIKSKINIGTSRRRRKKRRKERKRERKKRPFVSLNPLGNFHPSILPSIHPSIHPPVHPSDLSIQMRLSAKGRRVIIAAIIIILLIRSGPLPSNRRPSVVCSQAPPPPPPPFQEFLLRFPERKKMSNFPFTTGVIVSRLIGLTALYNHLNDI